MIRARLMGATRLGALVWLGAGSALAQTATEPPATLRLSPEEKAAILDHQTEESVDAARAGPAGRGDEHAIHGEIGAAVGTRGMHDIYGAAAIPLGDHAGMIVSFENRRYDPHR